MNMHSPNMKISNLDGTARYHPALQFLHWSIVVLIAIQFSIIMLLKQLQSLEFGQVVLAFHEQCGCILLLLIIIRLVAGFWLRPPSLRLPDWQILAAKVVHGSMLVALAAQPILGLIVAWSRGSDVRFLGLIPLPALVQLSSEQGLELVVWHRNLAYTLLALLVIHVAAIVFNRVVRKQFILDRMMPPPMVGERGRKFALARACFCLALIIALVVGVGVYAVRQYAALTTLRSRFDVIEATLLDDLRNAQTAVVKADHAALGGHTLPNPNAESVQTAKLVEEFPSRLTNQDARASAIAAAKSLREGGKMDSPHSKYAAASEELQNAIDSQNMMIFEGQMKVTETAAAARDVIMLAFIPTLMLGAVLVALMTHGILNRSFAGVRKRRRWDGIERRTRSYVKAMPTS